MADGPSANPWQSGCPTMRSKAQQAPAFTSLLIGLLAVSVGCHGSTDEAGGLQPDQPPLRPPTNLSQAQQQEALAQHNHWREEAGVPALRWSSQLAAYAQEWANELAEQGCTMEHRPRGGPFAQQHGENLFWASPVMWSDGRREVQPLAPRDVVDAWDEEKQWYDYGSNRCWAPPGESCGHYTQVVWARSEEIGCAMTICQDKAQLWACNYDPSGNHIGQKPY